MTEQRSVAFVDLCGYTRMTGVHGDESAAQQLADFRAVVRATVEAGCARVIRWMGDGVFLAGDCAGDLRLAIDRIDGARASEVGFGRLPVRAGMATGSVVAFDDDDIAGRAVNLAARLCDAASAHQVLADAATASELGAGSPLDPLQIKGFDEPVVVFDVSACTHGERRTDPICGMELDAEVAVRLTVPDGEVWFCSDMCAGRWQIAEAARG